ncbi:MAG: HAD family hydrolase [Gammaproteobacteria bacterium]|nr:HAD family hydrolase [Gammaproteobacteria bacterium]
MTTAAIRIAMWSGPRNISTALMRSFGSRADTTVCDEPLYAHYLAVTGLPHPGRDEVIAAHEPDWRRAAAWLTGPVPHGRPVWYQKHMAHHLLPVIERAWLDSLTNTFLVRDPAAMLPSLVAKTPDAGLADTGLPQQCELFDRVSDRLGRAPPVIDASDVLANPAGLLARLCRELGIAWDAAMLSWAPGRRETDGVWAKHWYHAVEASTGFQAPETAAPPSLPAALDGLHEQCLPYYQRLRAYRLQA